MQTCYQCNALSPDEAVNCVNCGADLSEFSTTEMARKEFIENPRVSLVRLLVADDSCPACQALEGAYQKDAVPKLPVEGCSHELGCRCFYKPYLTTIYP
jgi:hypothetical protein